MHYVKKFIICVFLSLVSIIPIHSGYADSCEIDVIAAADRKWRNINAQPMMSRDHLSSASLSVYDDMEIIQRYKARQPELETQYNREQLETPLTNDINETINQYYYECRKGQTIKDCDDRAYREHKASNARTAERTAKAEYEEYLKSQFCRGGSGGETLMRGSVDNTPVVDASAQSQELMNTIYNQKLAMTLGMSFVYSASDLKRINTYMNDWDRACKRVSKPKHADTTGFKNVPEGGKTKHICVIKTCKSQYTVSDDGLSCIKQNRSSGVGSTPASSSGGGSTSSSGGSEATSYQQIRDFIDDGARNISVGSSIVVKSDIIRGSAGVREHVNMWDEACTNLRNKPDRAATTGPKITTEGDDTRHTCIIKTCRGRGYEPAAGGTACALNESGDATTPASSSGGGSTPAPATPAGTEATAGGGTDQNQTIDRLPSKPAPLIPTGPSEPEKLVYIGGSLTFTDEELRNVAFSESVNNWERKCNSYPEDSDDVTINATYVKKDKKRKQNTWTCLIQSCNEDVAGLPQTPSPDGKSCISQDGSSCTAGDRHADRTRYDARQGMCIIETCKENYTLVDGKCEKTRKLERQQARATTRLEKDFVSDINKLSDAFEKVVKKITKECEKSGGTINNGVCENAPAPATDSKAKAPTNRRGSGRR